ncbi:hypothetical protein GCM10010228_77880 [Streptomyces massasporeus]|nr:hypothetical protein GCM10010228_77880 [Streptomyces massasporeus]
MLIAGLWPSISPPDKRMTRSPSRMSWHVFESPAARTAPHQAGYGPGWQGSSRAIREHLRERGSRAVIPVPANQRHHRLRRGSRGGRPPVFNREAYKQRNTVERCISACS